MLTKEQRALRRTGIGASEVSAVLGLPSYPSPLEVWRSKVEDVEQEDSADFRRGHALEPAVAALYEMETGVALDPGGPSIAHPRCPVLRCTPDRFARIEPRFPVELKTARGSQRHEFGEPGTDEVPSQYLVQVQVQMACSGAATGELAALIAGDDLRVYRFTRDAELESSIIESVSRWWRDYVETRTPPPVDGSEAWAERLASVRRAPRLLAATEEMRVAAHVLRAAKAAKKRAETEEAAARNALLALMGDAEGIEGVASYRETRGRPTTDWRGLCFAVGVPPSKVEEFTTRVGYRTLRLLGGKDND